MTWFNSADVERKSLLYTLVSCTLNQLETIACAAQWMYSNLYELWHFLAVISMKGWRKEWTDLFSLSFFLSLFYSSLFLPFFSLAPLSLFLSSSLSTPHFLSCYCIWIANVLQILHNCTEEWPFCSPFSVILYSSRMDDKSCINICIEFWIQCKICTIRRILFV